MFKRLLQPFKHEYREWVIKPSNAQMRVSAFCSICNEWSDRCVVFEHDPVPKCLDCVEWWGIGWDDM